MENIPFWLRFENVDIAKFNYFKFFISFMAWANLKNDPPPIC